MTPPMMRSIITPKGRSIQTDWIDLAVNGILRMPGGVMTPPYIEPRRAFVNPHMKKVENTT